MQVVQATVIPDDRMMLSGALKLAAPNPKAYRALYRELKAYARLIDQRDMPQVRLPTQPQPSIFSRSIPYIAARGWLSTVVCDA